MSDDEKDNTVMIKCTGKHGIIYLKLVLNTFMFNRIIKKSVEKKLKLLFGYYDQKLENKLVQYSYDDDNIYKDIKYIDDMTTHLGNLTYDLKNQKNNEKDYNKSDSHSYEYHYDILISENRYDIDLSCFTDVFVDFREYNMSDEKNYDFDFISRHMNGFKTYMSKNDKECICFCRYFDLLRFYKYFNHLNSTNRYISYIDGKDDNHYANLTYKKINKPINTSPIIAGKTNIFQRSPLRRSSPSRKRSPSL